MTAKTDEEKWFEEFGYLPLADQEALMAEAGYQPFSPFGGEADFYGGAEDYPMAGVAGLPEYTSKGALDPFDLTQAAKRATYAKSLGGITVDNALTALMGDLGAYDTDAFTPTMEYGNEVTRPGTTQLESFSRKGGYEGYIADEIMKGSTPSQAVASLQSFLEAVPDEDKERTPAEQERIDALKDSMTGLRPKGGQMTPSERKEAGFWGDYDYDALLDTAKQYSDAVFKDPAFGYSEEGPGGQMRYWETAPEEVKTDQMKWFDKYGLPYPTESYEDPKFLQAMLDAEEGTNPEYRAAEAADWEQSYQPLAEASRTAREQEKGLAAREGEMMKAWDERMVIPPRSEPYNITIPGHPAKAAGSTGTGVGMFNQLMSGEGGPAQLRPGQPTPQPGYPAQAPRDISLPGVNVPQAPFESPDAPWKPAPMVREIPGQGIGLINLQNAGPLAGAEREPQFGELDMWDALKGDTRGMFDFAPKGAKDRAMTEEDVDVRTTQKRKREAKAKTYEAGITRTRAERQDPRLNDLRQETYLRMLGQAGRTPLQDALASRRRGAGAMGL